MIEFNYNAPTAEQWNQLVYYTSWQKHSNATFETAIKNSLFFITAYDRNEIIGMIQVVGDGILSFYLQYLIVIPKYRNQGIGRKLVEQALHKIEELANTDAMIALFTSAKNRPFYQKLGFIERPNENQGPAMVYNL